MTHQLAFHDVQFNVITRNNKIWLTAVEIARALQYKTENSVSRIYARNSDEFTTGMSEEVKLTLSGNLTKSARVFSLRGAHLIAMFARTPVAKEFRRWVLDVLDREVGEPVIAPAPIAPTYPPFSADYANRAEIIYHQDFKPIFCRVLRPEETVMTPESMKEWLEVRGMIFFTREELKKLTIDELILLAN